MAFASHCGLDVSLDALVDSNADNHLAALFAEELGAVIQIRRADRDMVLKLCDSVGLSACVHVIARINSTDTIAINYQSSLLYEQSRLRLQRVWSKTSFEMQKLRDNPDCARQQYDLLLDEKDPGLCAQAAFDFKHNAFSSMINFQKKPKVAILREQGVNGHFEMAAAFTEAGFECIDVHMSDLLETRQTLNDFQLLAACGGFSYGDVLGAGGGWAKTILFNNLLKDQFSEFFHRSDTLGLGVCNGCQMMSGLRELVPGALHWPEFHRNKSEQFEARLVSVEIKKTASILLQGMEHSKLPVVVAHGEGRAVFAKEIAKDNIAKTSCLHYINHYGQVTEAYPFNPNGSPEGITGLCNEDGRFTIMMPHPERIFRTVQHSWRPNDWDQDKAPWFMLFKNAAQWFA